MPTVHLTETDRLNAVFIRAYSDCTYDPKIHNYEVISQTGIPEKTFYRRLRDPSQMRVSELRAIARAVGMKGEDLLHFILGRGENNV